MHDQDARSSPDVLVSVPDEQVRDLAAADARGEVPDDVAEWLRSPDMLDAWREALTWLVGDVQAQFTRHRATVEGARGTAQFHDAMKAHARWSAGASRFRQSVETRLREAKRLQRERDEAQHGEFRGNLQTRLDALEFEVGRLRRSLQVVAEEVSR